MSTQVSPYFSRQAERVSLPKGKVSALANGLDSNDCKAWLAEWSRWLEGYFSAWRPALGVKGVSLGFSVKAVPVS